MATIIVPDQVSAIEYAEALRRACKGWGTDEKTIISLLGHRNAAQRMQIRLAYLQLYQEDLIKRLESELTGDFKRALYQWILDPIDRDAVLAHVAIRKTSPVDYHVLIEISCIRSPEELLAVRRAYQARYKCSLEEDVAAHTASHFSKLLVALVNAFRYDGMEMNARQAKSEADILHNAIKEKAFSHEEVLRIVSTRSKTQLMATFNSYRHDHAISLSKNLQARESGDHYIEALHTTIKCINDSNKYFEKVLRNAIKRLGTDEDGLTRVIVTRAEKDLKDIKELYYQRNSVPLEQAVAKETHGDYKAFLLTLLGKED
ncbi:hypothetical protein SLE2022_207160 [Rubroshorea leprosula]